MGIAAAEPAGRIMTAHFSVPQHTNPSEPLDNGSATTAAGECSCAATPWQMMSPTAATWELQC